jgi:hypothetical protein
MLILLLLLLNGAIAWANCWSVGRAWNESRALGGWIRLLAWCGAIQAAIGFSTLVGFAVGAVLHVTGHLPPALAQQAFSLWYLLVIVPALGTGLVILIESWIVAWRERDLLSLSVAGYNTAAQLHNMYGAVDGIGQAWGNVSKLFGSLSDDSDNGGLALLAVGLMVLALASGAVLTYLLVRKYAGSLPLPERSSAR